MKPRLERVVRIIQARESHRMAGEQFLRMMELRHLPEKPLERVVKVAMLRRLHPLELIGMRRVYESPIVVPVRRRLRGTEA